MRRRDFIVGAISVAAASRVAAQPGPNNPRLAIFGPFEPTALMNERSENRYYRALFEELRRLGRIEGQNLAVERHGREQNSAGPAALVAEVVRSNPDIIYSVGPGTMLFKQATSKIPIVALTADPLAIGLIQNLARPGGNITGVSVDTGYSIHGKRIALLREIFPAMSKLGYLTLRIAWESVQGPGMRSASETTGVAVISSLLEPPTSEATYREAIANVSRDGGNAIMVGDTPDTMTNRALIVRLVAQAGLPAMYTSPEYVDAGGLMAYSFDLVELNKRAAADIDAILRGANAGDIPFYQTSKFELSVNLKTAKEVGLTVPETLLASAVNVIE